MSDILNIFNILNLPALSDAELRSLVKGAVDELANRAAAAQADEPDILLQIVPGMVLPKDCSRLRSILIEHGNKGVSLNSGLPSTIGEGGSIGRIYQYTLFSSKLSEDEHKFLEQVKKYASSPQ